MKGVGVGEGEGGEWWLWLWPAGEKVGTVRV